MNLGSTEGGYVEAVSGVFPGDHVVFKQRDLQNVKPSPENFAYPPNQSYSQFRGQAHTYPKSVQPVPLRSEPSSGNYEAAPSYQSAPIYSEEDRRYRYQPERQVAPPVNQYDLQLRGFDNGSRDAGGLYICPHGNVHRVHNHSSHDHRQHGGGNLYYQ